MIYLASPYSHPDAAIREYRFSQVTKAAGRLMHEGHIVYSPITHCHPIAVACGLPLGWDYWESNCRHFICSASRVVVLMLDGWKESQGVQAEIAMAQELGLEVDYIGQ